MSNLAITSQSFTLPPTYILSDNTPKLPIELIMTCLFKLDFKALLRFSLASKDCYVIAADPRLWKKLAQTLRISMALPYSKETFKKCYLAQNNYDSLRERILKKHLPDKVCTRIDRMPFWHEKMILIDDDELSLEQFPLQQIEDRKNHFFKAMMDGDLYVILIHSDRYFSKVIRINGSFEINSAKQQEFLWWEYSLVGLLGCFIDTTDGLKIRAQSLNDGWEKLHYDISIAFGIRQGA